MTLKLSSLPKDALKILLETFWAPYGPCQVRIILEALDEPGWQLERSFGEYTSETRSEYREASFLLGNFSV